MTKRYREALEEVLLTGAGPTPGPGRHAGEAPCEFGWRGQRYRVLQVLGHWREDPGWWRRADGQPIRIEQTDLWRVEAVNGIHSGGSGDGRQRTGVYELVRRGEQWRLDRVWD